MFGGPQQSAFVETMVNLGIKRGQDLSTGQPNVVSLMPNVRANNLDYVLVYSYGGHVEYQSHFPERYSFILRNSLFESRGEHHGELDYLDWPAGTC